MVSIFKYDETGHMGEKLHPCKECCKCYRTKACLIRHSSVHSRKPNYCKVCGNVLKERKTWRKTYRDTYKREIILLQRLWQMHQPETKLKDTHDISQIGETLYCCIDCGKCFTRSQGLRMNRTIHTGKKSYCVQYAINALPTRAI